MPRCPYCKAAMDEPLIPPALTKKQGAVFEAILSAGPDGISQAVLGKKFFKGLSRNTMRSCIHNINRVIRPLRLVSRAKSYILTEEVMEQVKMTKSLLVEGE